MQEGNCPEKLVMKRNFVPLLVVAFVVAIASTGIFYGLFVGKLKSAPAQNVIIAVKPLRPGAVVTAADLGTLQWSSSAIPKGMFIETQPVIGQTVIQTIDEGEPILESRLGSRPGGGVGVAGGMRAVSVHVSDSSGVLAMLRPGHRVDLQVFGARTAQGVEPEARTAFQNVLVLSAGTLAEPSSQGGFNAPVVTVLVEPHDADLLGIADSYGRIRLALRNPSDQGKESKGAMTLMSVLHGGAAVAQPLLPARANAAVTAPPAVTRPPVRLSVQFMSATPEAVDALGRFGISTPAGELRASTPGAAADLEKVLTELRGNKSVDVLSLSSVNAAMSRSASVELRGRDEGSVRVQFSPFVSNGRTKLRVQPEMTVEGGVAPGLRRVETEVDITGGKSFVISGLQDTATTSTGRQLLVLVTPAP